MHRFYLPSVECKADAFLLTGREAHHALHVLRVRRGDQVTVLDGAGSEFVCDVRDFDRDKIQLSIARNNPIPPLPYQITLLQSLPKGKLFEAIIQKAAELGAHRIVPLLSGRVTAQIDGEAIEHKTEKWRLVAIEAIKQCGSAWLPQIEPPVTPQQFLARKEKFDLQLVGSLQNGRRHPRDILREFQAKRRRLPQSIGVWIGPEGDFTIEELNEIQAAGALPISLGRLVLRVETAATYCLSILNYELEGSVPSFP